MIMRVPKFLKDPNIVRDCVCLEIFNHYADFLNIRTTPYLFYFGCGTGLPFLNNIFLHPELNQSAKIGWGDGSTEVVEEAQRMYQETDRVQVAHLDFSKGYRAIRQHQSVLSFWCLRSIYDIGKILGHIKDLLTPRGSAVVIFECSNFFRNVIGALAYRPEWRKYCLADAYPSICKFEGEQTVCTYIQHFFRNTEPFTVDCFLQKHAERIFHFEAGIEAFFDLYPTVNRLSREDALRLYLLFLEEIENYDGVVVETVGYKRIVKIPLKYIVLSIRKA